MRVKSAADFWYHIIVFILLAVLLGCVFIVPPESIPVCLLLVLVAAGFVLWMYLGTYYEFREKYLFCRSGPFTEKIYYDKIKSAALSQNLLSSLALSSKRIEIRQHGKGYITGTTMISPVNREMFLQQLLSRCKNIEK